ncbi:MAG TPA: penicillin-binding protein 2, partial [Actinomycetota bacterium]|nr:penicillin-binding protein 2 [Actinomycetota bacterium]
MTDGRTKNRMTVLAATVAFMFAALTTRLWFLQVLAQDEFAARAQDNRVRIVTVPAPRGRILDRNGKLLVTNRFSIAVTIDRTKLQADQQEQVLFRLSELLDEPVADLVRRMEDLRYYTFEPVPVAFDVTKDAAIYIGEHSDDFPGVGVQPVGIREYPLNAMAAHLLGYAGEISADELDEPRFAGYGQGSIVGKSGLEAVYERDLRGKEGLTKYEVNSRGEVLRSLGEQKPEVGNSLVVSIDSGIQKLTEDSLELGMELARGNGFHAPGGAALVMDPNNGQILAMAS